MRGAVALAVAIGGAAAGNARAGDVTGLWSTPASGGLIRIERCGEEVCGRSIASRVLDAHPDQTDVRNPDPALRARPVKGLLILKARPQGEDSWGEGWIYNPNDGTTYKLRMRLTAPDRLTITGCLVAPLCRSQVWTRSQG